MIHSISILCSRLAAGGKINTLINLLKKMCLYLIKHSATLICVAECVPFHSQGLVYVYCVANLLT